MWVRVGVSEGREQVQLICGPQTRVPGKVSCALSGSPGSLGARGVVGSRRPPGLSLPVSVLSREWARGFLRVSKTQVTDPRRVLVTPWPIWAGLA